MSISASPRLRRFVSVVSAPDAAVDEDRETMVREDQGRAAGTILSVQTRAQARLAGDPANRKLGSGVPPLETSHHLASRPLSTMPVMTFNHDSSCG